MQDKLEKILFQESGNCLYKDMLLCCLSKKGLTTIFELRNYFREKGDLSMQLSIQGYLQQRKRLNPEIFPYLNRNYLMDFYHSDEPKLWKGYLLMRLTEAKQRYLIQKKIEKHLETAATSIPKRARYGRW